MQGEGRTPERCDQPLMPVMKPPPGVVRTPAAGGGLPSITLGAGRGP